MASTFYQPVRRFHVAGLLLALLLVMVSSAAPAQDYAYTTNNGSATITRYTGAGGVVAIPGALGGFPVTSIGQSSFAFCSTVTGVTIPNSVTNIGDLAFIGCGSLTNVLFSSSVTNLGQLPFKSCAKLAAIAVTNNNPIFSSVGGVLFDKNQSTLVLYPLGKTGGSYAISNGVTSLGYAAFYGCTSLTNIVAPASLKNIEDTAFYNCTSLAGFTIPSGVTNIGIQTFQNCAGLTRVTIPDSVVSVGSQAFFSCGNLTNASLGLRVANVGDSTFAYCSKLASVTIGNGTTNIGTYAFEYCSLLASLTLGTNLASIGDSAFSYCYTLPGVTLPNGCASLGNHAFEYSSSLASISLPGSVTNIGDAAFEFCSSLTAITVAPNNPAYASVAGVLFDKGLMRLIQYPEGRAGYTYAIPDGVQSVADTAFAFAFNLASVTLPASVTNLEDLAFYDCADLTGIFCGGNPAALGNNVFDLVNSATVYYLPGTTGWGPTFGGLPTALWNPQAQNVVSGSGKYPGPFGFTITGNSNLPVVVEACTNFGGPWIPLQSVSLTNGNYYFGDPQWSNFPSRYYRLRSP